MSSRIFGLAFAATVLLICVSFGTARAEGPSPELLAAAKKEGEVRVAGDFVPPSWKGAKEAFEKKYPGITVETTYITAPAFIARLTAEQNAGQHLVDVSAINVANAAGIQQFRAQYISPYTDDHGPEFQSDPKGYWTQVVGISMGVLYNKKMVPENEAPKTLQDLLDPKWKGQIAIASPTVNDYPLSYFLAVDHELGGGEKSQKFFEALAAQKPLFFGPNGVPVAEGVKNGQFAIAIGFLSHVYAVGGGETGDIGVAPVTAYSNTGMGISVGVVATAPHPNAARLFVDFLLSREGADLMRQFGYLSTYKGVPPPDAFKVTHIVPAPAPAPVGLDAFRERLRGIFGL